MSVWISRIMRQISVGVVSASQEMSKSYEEAVRALNTLQSNASVLDKAKRERDRNRHLNVPQTIAFAERTGLKTQYVDTALADAGSQFNTHLDLYQTSHHFRLDDLDKLSIIHVSGTKGKGSTCAFCERILREHGFKTGFYSSPHLVEVRERIRINGRPLSKDTFSGYFWDCFNKLEATKDANGGTMPAYFRFLTIMAYQVFLQEQVDVAIIEVGIGGQYDCTNIIRSPVVCGVTSLDIDHTAVLGDTIEKIAWQKAGIFKRGVPAVTVPQPGNSIKVLMERAKEIEVPLRMAPPLDEYDWPSHRRALGIAGEKQRENASLALQLCKTWLGDYTKSIEERKQEYLSQLSDEVATLKMAEQFAVSETMGKALLMCEWPGRGQRVRRPGVTYYLDGAHTPSSIENCVAWYKKASNEDLGSLSGNVVKLLLFNSTGDRKPMDLLQIICRECDFDFAVFCPNIATSQNTADQTNYMVTNASQLGRVQSNKQSWLDLVRNKSNITTTSPTDVQSGPKGDCNQESLSLTMDHPTSDCALAYTFTNIHDTLTWLSKGADPFLPGPVNEGMGHDLPEALRNADHVQVLCTGSLHLIGGILRLIDPDINESHQ